MIGADELALMKPTAYLINTSRGPIIDEEALIEALQNETIAGVGIGVFSNEPPQVWDPHVPEVLRTMVNVILAPHNGGATFQSRSQQIMPVADAIRMFIQGERPPGLLNPEVYGEPALHPHVYGRGPIRPAVDGGIEDHAVHERRTQDRFFEPPSREASAVDGLVLRTAHLPGTELISTRE